MKHVLVEAIVFCSQPEDDALVSSGESVQVILQGRWSMDSFDESLYFSVADAVVSLGGWGSKLGQMVDSLVLQILLQSFFSVFCT